MYITGLGTAAPAQRYTQQQCWEALEASQPFRGLSGRSRAILKKVLTSSNGIGTRHLALERLEEAFDLGPDALHARFASHAPSLAAQAADRALTAAGLSAAEVDALIISTCTGYLCPGLTSYVSERLGLRADALLLDLVGQGCAAALPNWRAAEALLQARRAGRVLSVCVEVCSAALYLDDDPGVLISACLFGDGAGAAVLAAEPNGGRKLEWQTAGSLLRPGQREALCFEQRAGRLRNILKPEVPALAAEHAEQVLGTVLAEAGVRRTDVAVWALHPGGRDVLTALRSRLGLQETDVRWSAAVLHEYGNVSSSSLYFVLTAALAGGAEGGYWWLSSFGAGFSCHGALLHVE
jgi:alkylresorcinol/alkylpyrone synthase